MHHCGLKVYHFGPWTRQRMSYAISLIDPCPGANGGMLNMCSNGANMNLNFREILLQGTNISWNCCGTLTFFSLAKAHWAVCYSKEISVPQQRKNIPVSHGKFHISGVCHSKFSLFGTFSPRRLSKVCVFLGCSRILFFYWREGRWFVVSFWVCVVFCKGSPIFLLNTMYTGLLCDKHVTFIVMIITN